MSVLNREHSETKGVRIINLNTSKERRTLLPWEKSWPLCGKVPGAPGRSGRTWTARVGSRRGKLSAPRRGIAGGSSHRPVADYDPRRHPRVAGAQRETPGGGAKTESGRRPEAAPLSSSPTAQGPADTAAT